MTESYYKVWQASQSETKLIAKCGRYYEKSQEVVTKFDRYDNDYKVRDNRRLNLPVLCIFVLFFKLFKSILHMILVASHKSLVTTC